MMVSNRYSTRARTLPRPAVCRPSPPPPPPAHGTLTITNPLWTHSGHTWHFSALFTGTSPSGIQLASCYIDTFGTFAGSLTNELTPFSVTLAAASKDNDGIWSFLCHASLPDGTTATLPITKDSTFP